MRQKSTSGIKKNIANLLGSFGYLFCCLQWFWVVMLYFSVIQSVAPLVVPDANNKQVEHFPSFTFTPPDSVQVIILVVVVTIMVLVTIYALIKIPMGIVRTSNKAVHKTADAMAPIIIKAQHKKDTKKFHAKITSQLMLGIKVLAIVIPIVLTIASGLLKNQAIGYPVAITIGCGLACFTVVFFAVQYLLARLFHVKMTDLW